MNYNDAIDALRNLHKQLRAIEKLTPIFDGNAKAETYEHEVMERGKALEARLADVEREHKARIEALIGRSREAEVASLARLSESEKKALNIQSKAEQIFQNSLEESRLVTSQARAKAEEMIAQAERRAELLNEAAKDAQAKLDEVAKSCRQMKALADAEEARWKKAKAKLSEILGD